MGPGGSKASREVSRSNSLPILMCTYRYWFTYVLTQEPHYICLDFPDYVTSELADVSVSGLSGVIL